MAIWFVKSFDNYFKLMDDDSSVIVLTSGSDSSGSSTGINFNFLSESVPKYEGIRDSLISSSYFDPEYTGSTEYIPQFISESLWEEKKTEIKSYIINNI